MRITWTDAPDEHGRFPVRTAVVDSMDDPHPGGGDDPDPYAIGCWDDYVLLVPQAWTEQEVQAAHRLWELTIGESLTTVDGIEPQPGVTDLDPDHPAPLARLAQECGVELWAGRSGTLADAVEWFRATASTP